nr:copia protein [Tanacetum cinerariifolium]
MRPFGCPMTIHNNLDSLGKFNEKVDEGFLVGYSNNDGDAAFNGKEHDFDAKKPEKDASQLPDYPDMLELEEIIYSDDDDDVGAEADFNNLETSITVSPIPTTRVHRDHHVSQIIGDLSSTTQTRRGTQEVYLPHGKRAIGTKWVFKNTKDERGIVIRNKARLVAQGHTQEEKINYEEVFPPVARIEAIGLFLAYASFMGFMVYQMDINSAFLYGTIEEEVFVCQPLGFKDPKHPDKVYKVVKALYGLHQAPRAYQDKYIAKILRKFGLNEGISASTPIDTEKPLLKDLDGEDVDVHTYRSMIGSLISAVMDDESNQGRMIAKMDKDDVAVLMDEKEEENKVEEAKIDESAQVQGRQAESQAEIYKINMDHASKVLCIKEDEMLGIKFSKAFLLLVMMILLLVHFATVSAKKKTGQKITIQGSDVVGFDKSKVESFNCHKMGHFARECRAPRSQDRGKRESYKQGPKEEEPAPKALMAIDGIGWD